MITFIEGTLQIGNPLDNLYDDEISDKMNTAGDQNTALNANSLSAIIMEEHTIIQTDDQMTGDKMVASTVENIIIGKLTVDTITEYGVIIVISLVTKVVCAHHKTIR